MTPGLKDYFLEEQFIDGNVWNFEQLSTSEEQKLINLVKTFHKEGYSRMDLRRINFILNHLHPGHFAIFHFILFLKNIIKHSVVKHSLAGFY